MAAEPSAVKSEVSRLFLSLKKACLGVHLEHMKNSDASIIRRQPPS